VALWWNPPGLESVARTVKSNVPAASGVPDSSPAAERVTPAGGGARVDGPGVRRRAAVGHEEDLIGGGGFSVGQ
jgi:hypothetical protein